MKFVSAPPTQIFDFDFQYFVIVSPLATLFEFEDFAKVNNTQTMQCQTQKIASFCNYPTVEA
jgi:hypothetical protein